jgi:hypothetical protein
VNKAAGDVSVPLASATSWRAGLAQGSGFSSNIGVSVRLPWATLPSFHFVIYNFISTPYIGFTLNPYATSSSGVPATDPMTMDFSFSLSPKLGKGFTWNTALLWRDILAASQASIVRRITWGNEIDYRQKFFVRMGLQVQPAPQVLFTYIWPSFGIGFRTKYSEAGISWFCEDIGTAALSEYDQRFMLQYQLRFQ